MTDNNKYVISLYDYTGEALRPWAEAGYKCMAYDIQHDNTKSETFDSGGSIVYAKADLHDKATLDHLLTVYRRKQVVFGMAFPVCTDLSVSGAAHYAKKRKANPNFQWEATRHAVRCSYLFEGLEIPYFIENPVSVLSTLWRKPNYRFHPYEYGGYIPDAEAEHPKWSDYIAPKDAYPKKTCLWTSGNFRMPIKLPVKPEDGHSRQHLKLGGKSMKTKNIRSATPRGFAKAVWQANDPVIWRYSNLVA
jgi:hypothetical protein